MIADADGGRQAHLARVRGGLALYLALTGGAVDGVGYVILYHVFTAHMSGNSIAAGVYVGRGEWSSALHHAFPIPAFVLGVLSGAFLCEELLRRGARRVIAAAFALEVALLVLFLLLTGQETRTGGIPGPPSSQYYLAAVLPALAMGVQNAALRRVGTAKVRTTYITGMLTNAAEEAVVFLFWFRDRVRGRGIARLKRVFRVLPRQESLQHMLLFAGIWLAYILGAVLGTSAEIRFGVVVLAVPVAGLAAVAAWDFLRPIVERQNAGLKPDWEV